jgi:phosphonoacetaldehyde hydrolase
VIKAIIFDWAGTTVDFGCQTPVLVLQKIFARAGVPLEPAEPRHAMGLAKKVQIREICRLARVSEAWRCVHGAAPSEADVEKLYSEFLPIHLECAGRHSAVIDGVREVVDTLRCRGLKIGSTTGYTREMLRPILEKAALGGYQPDCSVTPEEVGAGRPLPWMLFENMRQLGVYPPNACIKVGDTPSDIEEALNADMWAVGVVASSSETRAYSAEAARARLAAAGAHHVIDTLAELPALVIRIDAGGGAVF